MTKPTTHPNFLPPRCRSVRPVESVSGYPVLFRSPLDQFHYIHGNRLYIAFVYGLWFLGQKQAEGGKRRIPEKCIPYEQAFLSSNSGFAHVLRTIHQPVRACLCCQRLLSGAFLVTKDAVQYQRRACRLGFVSAL